MCVDVHAVKMYRALLCALLGNMLRVTVHAVTAYRALRCTMLYNIMCVTVHAGRYCAPLCPKFDVWGKRNSDDKRTSRHRANAPNSSYNCFD